MAKNNEDPWDRKIAQVRQTVIADLTQLQDKCALMGMPICANIMRQTARIVTLEAEGYLFPMQSCLLNALTRSAKRDHMEDTVADGRHARPSASRGPARRTNILAHAGGGKLRLKKARHARKG